MRQEVGSSNYRSTSGTIILVEQGKIRVYTAENVKKLMLDNPDKRIQRNANAVYQVMTRNSEVLVEGQIPAELIQPVKISPNIGRKRRD